MTSTDIVVQDDGELVSTVTLFGTANPAEVVERASRAARLLEDLVRKQKLIVRIGQSEHVLVDGWTLLGSMLGVFPIVEWTRPVLRDGQQFGWEARVEARTRNGEVVGAAEAECLRDEPAWSFAPVNRYGKKLEPRGDYALRSMAQTRAVSKAMRLPLGFVMQIAGFNPTPAEEMPAQPDPEPPQPQPTPPPQPPPPVDDDGLFPPPNVAQGITKAQEKQLNVLVGQLRTAGHITTEQLWRRMRPGQEWPRDMDGELHWAPLRESLSKDEASGLIDRLGDLAHRVNNTDFAARAAEAIAKRKTSAEEPMAAIDAEDGLVQLSADTSPVSQVPVGAGELASLVEEEPEVVDAQGNEIEF